jgi:hypothetical protein
VGWLRPEKKIEWGASVGGLRTVPARLGIGEGPTYIPAAEIASYLFRDVDEVEAKIASLRN